MASEDAFGADAVLADLEAATLDAVIQAMLKELEERSAVRAGDLPALREALLGRESAGTTAVGNGVAIPHARLEGVRRMLLAVARVRSPGLPPGPDGQPVRLVFCFLSPRDAPVDEHLILLQRISRAARDPAWVQACLTAPGAEGFAQRLKTGTGRKPGTSSKSLS